MSVTAAAPAAGFGAPTYPVLMQVDVPLATTLAMLFSTAWTIGSARWVTAGASIAVVVVLLSRWRHVWSPVGGGTRVRAEIPCVPEVGA